MQIGDINSATRPIMQIGMGALFSLLNMRRDYKAPHAYRGTPKRRKMKRGPKSLLNTPNRLFGIHVRP